MRTYLKVRWKHELAGEPAWIFSELDQERREIRKVEVFRDGAMRSASVDSGGGETMVSEVPLPDLDEIAADPQFEASVISGGEFEKVWKLALSNGRQPGTYGGFAIPSNSGHDHAQFRLLQVCSGSQGLLFRTTLTVSSAYPWKEGIEGEDVPGSVLEFRQLTLAADKLATLSVAIGRWLEDYSEFDCDVGSGDTVRIRTGLNAGKICSREQPMLTLEVCDFHARAEVSFQVDQSCLTLMRQGMERIMRAREVRSA